MKLRTATKNDWKILLDWRNDQLTRENSFNQSEISEQDHMKWFLHSLSDEMSQIYIMEDNGVPIGTIRSSMMDIYTSTNRLSWTISPDHRGKNYGSIMLQEFLKNRTGKFIAEIKESNIASINMVKRNGFKFLPTDITMSDGDVDFLTFYKNQDKTDLDIISEIEKIRGNNNVNWMDILRIAFTYAPDETRKVFKKITDDDNLINELSKQLANNG